jgi:hypothetical protein
MSMIRQMLAIAENARIDHAAGHPQPAAPYNSAQDRAAVRRAVARGWLRVTASSRSEVWAAITDAGRVELARALGDAPPSL